MFPSFYTCKQFHSVVTSPSHSCYLSYLILIIENQHKFARWQRGWNDWKLNRANYSLFMDGVYYFQPPPPKKNKTIDRFKPKTGKGVGETPASNVDNSCLVNCWLLISFKTIIIWIAENQESFPCHCLHSFNIGTEDGQGSCNIIYTVDIFDFSWLLLYSWSYHFL